ncbi:MULTISPECIES: cbb3-type cytochrome c oxidase subunit I [Halomonas]|uniref:Cbb3-type cytochrome c oxidase subunit I n=3 Tax=Halomonas TaxID=2745 RepID=A0AAU7KHF8_9GAMM|nr:MULTISPECIES: cbb3-type cytochrome c oxidase subunit I [Halomonas]MBR9772855.1 nitric-oxide reductase large subunit [Gammaproteobacteria bacterium]MAR73598.1 nitric-oxide reductase large subunit [Halomonas sp.]MBR9880362.1 nitric-oxide reductase large subunit [Gammaproteobacteria bacterium]MBS8269503.1 nitric-oxide reductase large subunit [Halomonas litopenaei]MBY6111020.1 cbb3-type cytochrome c oxidase subunit I [Halomonas sp. DP1Y21-3]
MKYETQKVAYAFFLVAMGLFALQLVFGIMAALVYVFPDFLAQLMPFNIIRVSHTNLLIVWLLIGFMGCTYYLMPEEAEREIHSPMLAYLQLGIFVVAGVAALVCYQLGIHEGREFLEQPFFVKVLITVSFLIFLYNTSMTLLKGRKTTINLVLMLGLWLAAVFWLFAFYNPGNLAVDKVYWWWVVHLWVEGVWELIMASLLGYLLIKMSGVDREVIEKWLYVIVGLSLFSGLLGTGHHYYWIGTPGYWQAIGSIFSTLEVIPFFAMVVFAFVMFWKGSRNHPNKAAMLWTMGCPTVAFFGAGVWGFMHTLSFINYYSHGTQVTAAHGHLAFYGAYVMLILGVITYAMPQLRRSQPFNQVLNMWGFWILTSAMCFMTFTLTFAGAVQTHLQRVLGMNYMEVQDQLGLFYTMRLGTGIAVTVGAVLLLYALFGPARRSASGQPAMSAS